jgi:hypothetical protein
MRPRLTGDVRHERRAEHHARNAGLQRLRKLSRALAVAATALAAIFAGIAAASNSGRKHPRVAKRAPTPGRRAPAKPVPKRIPPPPSLPPIRSGEGAEQESPPPEQAQPQQPSQPAPAPQQPVAPPPPAPPVAVSGGS